jgi:putative salt-induced outer membrane protein
MTLRARRVYLLLGATLAAVISTARAQDAAPKDTVKKFTAVFNLGLVNSSGNTSLTTLSVGDEITYKEKVWTFKQVAAYVYAKNDSVETADQFAFGLRAERSLGDRWGLYAGARFYRDPFAGIAQRYSEQVGAIWHAVIAKKDKLDFEAGVGLTQERSTDDSTNDFPNGRAAVMYRHSWKEKTYFQETAEILPDLKDSENYRANSLTELLAPLSENISMRLAYAIAYNNRPQPGFKDADRVLTAGIQLNF